MWIYVFWFECFFYQCIYARNHCLQQPPRGPKKKVIFYEIIKKPNTLYNRLSQGGKNDKHSISALEWYEKQLSVIEQFGSDSGAAQDSVRSQKEHPKLLKGRALGNVGNALRNLMDLPRACEFPERALRAFQEMGDVRSEAITLNNLSSIYLYIGQIRKGQEYAKLQADLVASNPSPKLMPGQQIDSLNRKMFSW